VKSTRTSSQAQLEPNEDTYPSKKPKKFTNTSHSQPRVVQEEDEGDSSEPEAGVDLDDESEDGETRHVTGDQIFIEEDEAEDNRTEEDDED
jgi:hypothetical protein